MRRFEALLSRADEVDPVLRARALRDFGGTAQMAGDLERAEQAYCGKRRALRGQPGDEAGSATIVFRFGVAAAWRGDSGRARSLYEESLATFRSTRRCESASSKCSAISAVSSSTPNIRNARSS
jgi:hypothetical protein